MPLAAQTLPPPLHNGDRLTSEEFMLRWEAMPDVKHAELIDGIVHMASPLGNPHGYFQVVLCGWISQYMAASPGCEAVAEATWLMGEHDVSQPDIALRILPEYGGQSRLEGIYCAGAPELVVEVAASSEGRDLGEKFRLYERMGVREDIVALTKKEKVLWHQLTPQGFELAKPSADGIFRSAVFPGLWLDEAALWSRENARLYSVLQQGLLSPEHAALAKRSN